MAWPSGSGTGSFMSLWSRCQLGDVIRGMAYKVAVPVRGKLILASGKRPQFPTVDLSVGLIECPHNMAVDSSPQQVIQEKAGMESSVVRDPASVATSVISAAVT